MLSRLWTARGVAGILYRARKDSVARDESGSKRMGKILPPEPVRFFVAVLAADAARLATARETLAREWGAPDLDSGSLPFRYTDYYEKEAGPEILRAFFGFPGGFDPGELSARKRRANELETELAQACGAGLPRPVNLDPGYLAPDKLVLASAKNFSHRLYLGGGVYGEVTLMYRHERFESFEWSFPDYASGDYDPFFLALRKKLMTERKGLSHA